MIRILCTTCVFALVASLLAQEAVSEANDACVSADFYERLMGCREFWLEYVAQFEGQDPCDLLPPPTYNASGERYFTGEALIAEGRCANYRAATLQEILHQSGIDCAAFDVIHGRCDPMSIIGADSLVIPGADAAAQVEALDQMIDVLTEGIVVE